MTVEHSLWDMWKLKKNIKRGLGALQRLTRFYSTLQTIYQPSQRILTYSKL